MSCRLLPFLLLALAPLRALEPVSFEQVRPVLETRCLECHNPDKVKGKLLMSTQAGFLKGGANGPIIEPGQPDRSELVKRVHLPKDHEDLMPPKGGPLPPAELALLRGWVAAGAPGPRARPSPRALKMPWIPRPTSRLSCRRSRNWRFSLRS